MQGKALLVTLFATSLMALPSSANAEDYGHVHLRTTDHLAAAQWYIDHMDCQAYEREGACKVDDIQILFYSDGAEPTGPSVGSGIDHLGFSFTDLEAKMAGWKAAGVKILEDIREVQGLFKLAFVEDPWGTKIEVVEDLQWLGFHHIHLRSEDPGTTLSWYEELFGGIPDKMKGRLTGLRYNTVGTRGVWLLVGQQRDGTLEPTVGRAFDHLGWIVDDMDAYISMLQGKGMELDDGPREVTNSAGEDLIIAFLISAEGVRIELVQYVN